MWSSLIYTIGIFTNIHSSLIRRILESGIRQQQSPFTYSIYICTPSFSLYFHNYFHNHNSNSHKFSTKPEHHQLSLANLDFTHYNFRHQVPLKSQEETIITPCHDFGDPSPPSYPSSSSSIITSRPYSLITCCILLEYILKLDYLFYVSSEIVGARVKSPDHSCMN